MTMMTPYGVIGWERVKRDGRCGVRISSSLLHYHCVSYSIRYNVWIVGVAIHTYVLHTNCSYGYESRHIRNTSNIKGTLNPPVLTCKVNIPAFMYFLFVCLSVHFE